MGENTAAHRRFRELYPFYFVGTTLDLSAALHGFSTLDFWRLLAGLFFEKNRPAVMWRDMLTGRIKL